MITIKETDEKYYGSERIFWVDDEQEITDSFELLLESMGHKADCASSGQEALKLLTNNLYYLMITDIEMPQMNG